MRASGTDRAVALRLGPHRGLRPRVPAGRYFHSLSYEPVERLLVVFGGTRGAMFETPPSEARPTPALQRATQAPDEARGCPQGSASLGQPA